MSEARADLPAAGAGAAAMNLKPALPAPSGQTPDTVLRSPSVGAAPQAQARPIPTQDATDDGLPPELQGLGPVADKIMSKENAGHDPNLISGGGHFGYPQGVKVGAGLFQDIPSTWEKHIGPEVQQKYGKTLDFNNPADQMFGNLYWANKTYGVDSKGRTLQEAVKVNEVDYTKLSDQWIGLKSGPSLRDQMFATSSVGQQMAPVLAQIGEHARRDRETYEQMAAQPLPGVKEREGMLDEARGRAREARDLYSQLGRTPPVEKPIDALQNFGSMGTMLALLIGGMGRHHMNGALMAAGGMMQAAQANNHEQFERQFKVWDHQSNIALNLAHLENEQIRDIMEDRRLTQNERDAALNNFYREHGMTYQADQLQAGLTERAITAWEHTQTLQHSMANQKAEFGRQMATQELAAHPERDPAEVFAKWNWASPAGVKNAGAGAKGGLLEPEDRKVMASQYIAGDKSVLSGLGFGNIGATNRANVRKEITAQELSSAKNEFVKSFGREPNAEEKEQLVSDIGRRLALAMAEYSGLQAGERSAFSRIAGLSTAAAEADKFTPIALEASKKVTRTQFPRLNEILLAAAEGSGNEDVINLAIATNSLADAFAQVIGRGNSQMTDAARNQALSMLQMKWSEGQYATAVEGLRREIRAAQEAPEEVLKRFRSTFGIGEGAVPLAGEVKPFSANQSVPSVAKSPVGGIPVGTENAGDKDGTTYTGSDGKTYEKRGNYMVPQ